MRFSIKQFVVTLAGCVILCTIVVHSFHGQAGNKVPSAQTLIDAALKAAKAQNKTLFVHFGASWCSWCKQLDAMLHSREVGKLIADHFVLVNLTVQESDDKKSTENPGAEKLMTDTGGGETGVPYYLFLDKNGAKIGNSMVMPNDANIGYPATPEEIKTFGELMVKVAPRMTSAQRALIVDYLTKHAPKDADAGTDSTRAAFLKIVDRQRVPLAPQTQPLSKIPGITGTHFSFASDSEQRVPGIMLKRADSQGRLPVVIALHGTGGSKEDFGGLLQELANRGFVAVAIDGRYHGERTRSRLGDDYEDAIFRAYKTGKEHPLYYDTAWDVMRLIDYLQTRDDVDPKRIGLLGISKGGIETYLAAAADPRVAVAVPSIGVQSFHWALEHDLWESRVGTFQSAIDRSAKDAGSSVNAQFIRKFYDRVVPGIYADFDGPAMLPLIAPRPLLVINGDSDSLTPMPGVLEAAKTATEAYAAAGAKEKFVLRVQKNTGHDVTLASLQEAITWFTTWLKP